MRKTDVRDGRDQAVSIPIFPGYFINKEGCVWSAHRKGRIPFGSSRFLDPSDWDLRKPWRDPEGYLHVTLAVGRSNQRQRVALHILVARTFLGDRPPGLVVAHLDGDKSNNHASNLAYVTQRENIGHKRQHKTMICGDQSHMSRLSDAQCVEMIELISLGFPRREIARIFGVSLAHVFALKSGRIRKHLNRIGK